MTPTDDISAGLGSVGNYELVEQIGAGNFGTVYKARHWESKQLVAVKVISPALARNATLRKRFHQECLLASKINHPNAVRVVEHSLNSATPFLVMEFVEGVSLGEKLERDGKFDEAEAIEIIVQVCQGLEQIHSLGLLHRDIKPDNVVLTPEGIAKIVDLGLAKDVDTSDSGLTRTGTGLGTPNFIAPEQFRNAKNVDQRCDIYSLAATLYQMVTGVLPFADSKPVNVLMRKLQNKIVLPQALVKSLNHRTSKTILKALNIRPEDRYGSCWEFVDALVDVNSGLGAEFEKKASKSEFWYIYFTSEKGQPCRATGHTAAVLEAVEQDQLGDLSAVRLGPTMAGPFKTLTECLQFPEDIATAIACATSSEKTLRPSANGSPPIAVNGRLQEPGSNSPGDTNGRFGSHVNAAQGQADNSPVSSSHRPSEAWRERDIIRSGAGSHTPYRSSENLIRQHNPDEREEIKQRLLKSRKHKSGKKASRNHFLPQMPIRASRATQHSDEASRGWSSAVVLVLTGLVSFLAAYFFLGLK